MKVKFIVNKHFQVSYCMMLEGIMDSLTVYSLTVYSPKVCDGPVCSRLHIFKV